MPPRRKSRIERLLSLNQHRKRLGAKGAVDPDGSLDAMKTTTIDAGSKVWTRGSNKSLSTHFEDLRREFHGQLELVFHHAKLIVLIRREAELRKHFELFTSLWETEEAFLLKHLDTRWLLAAVDTFVDHDDDPVVRSLGMAAICLVNSIKLAETERVLCESKTLPLSPERVAEIQTRRVALFDGTSGFTVGTDDTLRHMRWRLDNVRDLCITGRILGELFDRMQEHDTVYARFRAAHTRQRTSWWT